MRNSLLVPFLLGSTLVAQHAQHPDNVARADIDGRIGIDMQSQYFFRGILQENQGLIAQPWVELDFDLLDGEEGLRDLKIVAGQWNSLHDAAQTGATGGIWYESRFFLGFEAQLGDRLQAGVRYNTFATPTARPGFSLNARPVQELAFYGNFDDTNLLFEEFSLQPHVLLAHELSGQRDGGTDRGTYLEFGIEPAIEVTRFGDAPLTISAPITLGLGIGDYYERSDTAGTGAGGNADFFGYLQAGAVAHLPIGCTPERCGPLMLDAGVHLIVLGDNQESRNGSDLAELFLTIGISTAF